MTQKRGSKLRRLVAASALTLYLLTLARPGGYVAWSGLRLIVLLVSLLWVLYRRRELSWSVRAVSTAVVVLGLSIHWLEGVPYSNRFCGDRILESKAFNEWTAVALERNCGATVSYQYLVLLSTGNGWLRREHLLLKTYRSPTPEILSFDSNGLSLKLAFFSSAKGEVRTFAPAKVERTLEYYDGMLQ